ncbi:MAG TPA: response regulator [Candidatus Binatia bacterium]|nr:response regulator [Candidatus Binatia bacterium]
MSEPDQKIDVRDRPVVLLVEDEVMIRWAVAEALRADGMLVVEASNAGEAIDAVMGGIRPDILFTDVRMPGHLDGIQLAAFLEASLPGLEVIIASAYFQREDLKFHVNFVSKPYDPKNVAKKIADALKA